MASVNLTRMELESDGMRSCMEWLESILRNTASTHSEHQRLCLALDVGEPYPWLLYICLLYTSRDSHGTGKRRIHLGNVSHPC